MISLEELRDFVLLEQDAIRERAEYESLLTERALVATGRAIAGLRASSIQDSIVTLRCLENFAHFRPGDRLILSDNGRQIRATLLTLRDGGLTLELDVSRSTTELLEGTWTAREETTDLTISYLTALKKLQPGAPGWSFFRIVTGQKAPKPSDPHERSTLFPARRFFRAASQVISTRRQAERPLDNRWKFRWQSGEPDLAESPSLVRDVAGIDDLFLFNRTVHDRLVA